METLNAPALPMPPTFHHETPHATLKRLVETANRIRQAGLSPDAEEGYGPIPDIDATPSKVGKITLEFIITPQTPSNEMRIGNTLLHANHPIAMQPAWIEQRISIGYPGSVYRRPAASLKPEQPDDTPLAAAGNPGTVVQQPKPEVRLLGNAARPTTRLAQNLAANPDGEYIGGLHREKKQPSRLRAFARRIGSLSVAATASIALFPIVDRLMS